MTSKKELISVRGQNGITQTGWNLIVATEQEWIVAGEVLVEIDQARQWWLGDWFNRCKWGDGRVACDMIGINYETARTCGKIAKKFKLGVRRPNLTFTHHKVIAYLDDKAKQEELLEWAIEKKATVRGLREKVREHMQLTSIPIEEKKLLYKPTEPEVKDILEKAIEAIQDETKEIWMDDLKQLVDTVADNVEGVEASAVLFHASNVYRKSDVSSRKPKIPRVKTDVEIMVNIFHSFLRRLEKVQTTGHENMSEQDRRIMTQEFRLMVPKALRLFDWMGIDLQQIVTNYVNRIKEVSHVQQDAERLVSD